MKKLMIFVYVFISVSVYSQVANDMAEVKFAKDLPVKSVGYIPKVFSSDENGLYISYKALSRFQLRKVFVANFDNKLSLIKTGETKLFDDGKERDFESFIQTKSNTFLFTSYNNKTHKKRYCFVQPYDGKLNGGVGEPVKIAEVEATQTLFRRSSWIEQSISPDSTKVLVNTILPYKADEPQKFSLWVFDAEMSQLWKRDVALPYTDELFEIIETQVNNDGNVFVLGKLYNEVKRNRRKGEPNFKYVVFSYMENGSKEIEYPIEISGKYLNDCRLIVHDSGNLYFFGYYSDVNAYSYKGAVNVFIDPKSSTIIKTNTYEFPLELITAYMKKSKASKASKKAEKGGNVELGRYDIQEPLRTKDGGAYIISEFRQSITNTTTQTVNGVTTTKTTTTYYYRNMLVIKINNEGDILWAKKIPKFQRSSISHNSVVNRIFVASYHAIVKDNDLYMFYIDNTDNLHITEAMAPKETFGGKNLSLIVLKASPDGTVTRKSLVSKQQTKFISSPYFASNLSDGSVLMFFYKGSKVMPARIVIK